MLVRRWFLAVPGRNLDAVGVVVVVPSPFENGLPFVFTCSVSRGSLDITFAVSVRPFSLRSWRVMQRLPLSRCSTRRQRGSNPSRLAEKNHGCQPRVLQ